MIVLYTNIGLDRRTGTEVVTADLARTVKARGHEPIVYSPSLGEVAREIEAEGIPVVEDLSRLSVIPDVIHGHHHYETIQAIQRFPEVPALFVCHDVNAWHDEVPHHPNIRRFVAVGLNARRRFIRDWPQTRRRIEVIGNGVDMPRFLPRSPLPATPRRALVFSNDAGDDSHWEPIAEACRKLGIEVDRVGLASGNQVGAPERLLPDYDLVFAKGRCAFEAAAVGAAVVLCDIQGLGQMVTSRNVVRLRSWNFGMRTLHRPINLALIVEEIRRYDAGDAAEVRDFIRANASLSCAADRYLDVYRRIRVEGVPSGTPDGPSPRYPETRRLETADQAALQIQTEGPPREVRAGEGFSLRVKLRSRMAVPVATSPPWPALFFHRWYEEDSDRPLPGETPRGILQPPMRPNTAREYTIRAVAPHKAGQFRLRITLIQEGWRWLDELEPRVFADHRVTVIPGGSKGAGKSSRNDGRSRHYGAFWEGGI